MAVTNVPITVKSGSGALDGVEIECIVSASFSTSVDTDETQCWRIYPSKNTYGIGISTSIDVEYLYKGNTTPITASTGGNILELWFLEGNLYGSGSGLMTSSDFTGSIDDKLAGSFTIETPIWTWNAISDVLTSGH